MYHLFVGFHYEGEEYLESFHSAEDALDYLNDEKVYADYAFVYSDETGRLTVEANFEYIGNREWKRE